MEVVIGGDVIALLLGCWGGVSNIYIPTGRRRETAMK